MFMQVKLNKWGNSWAIRLPANYLKDVGIDPHQSVELNLEKDCLIIRKTTHSYHGKYSLTQLLQDVRPEQLHGESWADSNPSGKEIW